MQTRSPLLLISLLEQLQLVYKKLLSLGLIDALRIDSSQKVLSLKLFALLMILICQKRKNSAHNHQLNLFVNGLTMDSGMTEVKLS